MKPGFLRRLDDAILDRLATVLVRIRTRFGADKDETLRGLHAFGAVACVAWTAGSGAVDPLLTVFPGINVLLEAATAFSHHRRIGSADTARGWEKAAREAGWERESGRTLRTLMLVSLSVTYAFVASIAFMFPSVGPEGMSGSLAALANGAAMAWLAVVCLSYHLKAVPPPHPDFRRSEDRLGREVPQS